MQEQLNFFLPPNEIKYLEHVLNCTSLRFVSLTRFVEYNSRHTAREFKLSSSIL